jgi:hypothetical protein
LTKIKFIGESLCQRKKKGIKKAKNLKSLLKRHKKKINPIDMIANPTPIKALGFNR